MVPYLAVQRLKAVVIQLSLVLLKSVWQEIQKQEHQVVRVLPEQSYKYKAVPCRDSFFIAKSYPQSKGLRADILF